MEEASNPVDDDPAPFDYVDYRILEGRISITPAFSSESSSL
jgi:hypothetical protein